MNPTMRTALAVVAAAALTLTGCGANQMAVSSEPAAWAAFVSTFDESFEWDATLALNFADADLERLDEATAEQPVHDDPWGEDGPGLHAADGRLPSVRESLEALEGHAGTNRAVGAVATDGSWRFGLADGPVTWLDVRVHTGDLFADEAAGEDSVLLARLDLDHIAAEFASDEAEGSHTALHAMAQDTIDEMFADTDVHPALSALLDSRWAGLVGPLDVPGTVERSGAGELEGRDLRRFVDAAATIRDFSPDGQGGSTAVIDLHPQAAIDVLEDLDVETRTHSDEPLPATLTDAATVAFDRDGHVTQVAVNLLGIARDVARHSVEHDTEVAHDPMTEQIADLSDDSTAALIVDVSSHGQVDTTLDVPDAATVTWETAGDAAGTFFMGAAGVPDQPDVSLSWDEVGEDRGQFAVEGALSMAAFDYERFYAEHGRYGSADEVLLDADPQVDIVAFVSDDGQSYCLEGFHRVPGQGRPLVPDAILDGAVVHTDRSCGEL